MFASLSVTVPSFTTLLALGGIFFIFLYFYAASDKTDVVHLPYDTLLRSRMALGGIPNWKALQQKAGLSYLRLDRVRRGEIGLLRFNELQRLADTLNWTVSELLHNFGISSIAENQVMAGAREIEELQQESARLLLRLQQQGAENTADLRYLTFQQLQTLLTNYPSARQMALAKPDLPAKNITSLFSPLDNLLETWGYDRIGSAWEQVRYNPQIHQADASDIAEGELVYIRFVGYREGDRLLCPAKVSRTLPPGIKK